MIDYSAKIAGDTRVALRFDRFPQLAHDGLRQKLGDLTEQLAGAVEAAVPRGKTGRLAAQVQSGVQDSENRVRGWVSLAGADANLVKQAAALEYGSRGSPFAVKGYTRSLDQVFGKISAPFQQVIEAYQRTGGLEPDRFLRGPLAERASGALSEMNAVVEKAIKESE
jgi:hypothetical protein